MKIICIGTFKGGVGKTMLTFNIAGFLAEKGYKVLSIDMDAQGNLTNNIGIDKTKQDFNSIKDVLEQSIEIENAIIKKPIKELPTFDLIPSSFFLIETEIKLMNRANRENILKNYIEDNINFFNTYDYVILDTNPSMSIINQNAFSCADSILLVTDPDLNAIDGIMLFQALWWNIRKDLRIDNNIKAIIINKIDNRLNISKDFIQYCNTIDGIKEILYKNSIPKNVKLQESIIKALPINLYDKNSTGYASFNKLIEELFIRNVL